MTIDSIVFCSKAKRLIPAALFSACLLGSAAQAAEGFYVLGSVGAARFDPDADKSDRDAYLADIVGFGPKHSSQDENDTGYKFQIGYQFNDNFALEGGYTDLGQLEYKAQYTGVSGKEEYSAKGWNIDALLTLPVHAGFSLFAKIGAIDAKVKDKVSLHSKVQNYSANEDDTKIKPKFGVGVAYNFYDALSARVEAEHYAKLGDDDKTGESNVQLYSVGLSYKF